MVRVDNTQICADYYCGYDRSKPLIAPDTSGKELAHGMQTEVPGALAFGALPLVPLASPMHPWRATKLYTGSLWQSFGSDRSFSEILKRNRKAQQIKLERQKLYNGTNFADKYRYKVLNNYDSDLINKSMVKDLSRNKSAKQLLKDANKREIYKCYKQALSRINALKKSPLKGEALKKEYQEILKLLEKGDYKLNYARKIGLIKPTSTLGKVGHFLKSKSGYYNAKGFMLKTKAGRGAFKGLKGFGKIGVGLAVLAETLAQAPDVMGAREIDKQERAAGRQSNRFKKQLVKSGATVAAVTAGSVLGSMAAGAALGAACGTVVPIVGNIVGFIGGAIGGLLAGWGAKKLLGKSEVQKYHEQQQAKAKKEAEELAKKARTDKETKDQMLTALNEQKGEITDKKVLAALEAETNARIKEVEAIAASEEKVENTSNIFESAAKTDALSTFKPIDTNNLFETTQTSIANIPTMPPSMSFNIPPLINPTMIP